MRKFKILKSYGETNKNIPEFFPWVLLNEINAQKFHSQTLERLNQLGGLTIEEIYCNINGVDYFKFKFNRDALLKWIDDKIKSVTEQ